MKKALYILKRVLKDTIMTSEQNYIKEAIAELEDLKCCQNCKHFSMFDGKVECKNCYAANHTNWESKC